jgi:hypothetical protein
VCRECSGRKDEASIESETAGAGAGACVDGAKKSERVSAF